MTLLYTRVLLSAIKYVPTVGITLKGHIRTLISKQLVYKEFGDPVQVVKFREVEIPPLASQEVLVRMLAAPVNPADINTIQGRNLFLPCLPSTPGDEGVGEVVEIGDLVCRVEVGERVVLTTRHLGTWCYYGVYHERDVHVISSKLPLPEASMLTIAPCNAYRMLKDFRNLNPGDTVIQNAANSPCGQCVIQLCKAWGINTFNIVANHCNYEKVREYLLSIGATAVYTLEEAEELTSFDTSLVRPILGLNCLGGRYEDVMIKLLASCGVIVYYGCAFNLPQVKQYLRPDLEFCKFHLTDWDARAGILCKDVMMNDIIQMMVIGKLRAPIYQPIELKNYIYAIRNTTNCEAFATMNFVFDLTLP